MKRILLVGLFVSCLSIYAQLQEGGLLNDFEFELQKSELRNSFELGLQDMESMPVSQVEHNIDCILEQAAMMKALLAHTPSTQQVHKEFVETEIMNMTVHTDFFEKCMPIENAQTSLINAFVFVLQKSTQPSKIQQLDIDMSIVCLKKMRNYLHADEENKKGMKEDFFKQYCITRQYFNRDN